MASTLPAREADGSLPAFAWPGGYAIAYVVDDGELLCAADATADGHEGGIPDGWRLEGFISSDWHDIGEGDWVCSHCSKIISEAPTED